MTTISTAAPLVTLDRVTVRLGGRPVLRDVTFALSRGEVVGITGPNGAGKTTFLRVAARLVRPAAGTRTGQPRLAYVPPALQPPLLAAGAWLRGVRRDRAVEPVTVLDRLGFDGDLDRPCRELSFGNLRKLLLADAFSSRAELVVIDEASEGLDSRGAATVVALMAEVRARGAAVLFSEQETQRIAGADRVAAVRDGVVTVDAVHAAGEISVQLRGPAARLADLTAQAEALGFRYTVERE